MRGTGRILVALVVCAGCYRASPATGVPCPDGVCPRGQECSVDLVCVGPGGTVDDAGVDAIVVDAPSCDGGCSGETPVCDATTHACRGCVADAECASDACLEYAGTCADEASVVYVAPLGGGDGTRAAPTSIGNVSARITTTRNIVKLAAGGYTQQLHFGMPATVSGPTLDPSPVTLSTSNGASVVLNAPTIIEGMTIQAPQGDAIRNDAVLTLHHVRLTATAQAGVEAHADLHVFDSELSDTGANAIYSTTGGILVEIARTKFVANNRAIHLESATLDLTSSIIVRSGDPNQPVTAVSLVAPNPTSRITYCTFADNINDGTLPTTISSDTSINVSNSIIFELAPTPVSSAVNVSNTLFRTNIGNGNFAGEAAFVGGGDYHITSQSAARGRGSNTNGLPDDIDRESRPRGQRSDVGADEIP